MAFLKTVYGSPAVTVQQLVSGNLAPGAVRITYRSRETFKKAAKALGLMDDFKVWALCYKSYLNADILYFC